MSRGTRVALAATTLLACARPPAAEPPRAIGARVTRSRTAPDSVATPPAPARRREDVARAIRAVLDRALADSAFPGAYAVVGDTAGPIAEYGVGRIDWAADAPRPDSTTRWDLASLTKVVGTTSAMLQLVADGRVALDTPVAHYLPAFAPADAPEKARITVRHLLTHASGLPAWRPLYKESDSPAAALALALATRPGAAPDGRHMAPGVRYVYSDLNFITLGALVARVTGEPLDAYLARHVFGPLGMRDTRYETAPPPAAELARIAPTEYDPWRQRKLRGEVHDENAFALGRVSGHAGLFSSGADLGRLARAYLRHGTLDGRRVFDSAAVARFTRAQDTAVSRRALGWETPTGGNSAGHYLSRRAFGHTGFTGTSMWMDPERGVYVVLLTNRVNPTRMNTKVGAVRVALADAAIRALGAPPVFPAPATAARP